MNSNAKRLIDITQQLSDRVRRLKFKAPVAYVYNPLEYAWDAHRAYLEKYTPASCDVLFLGMNPGPFGMAQTGVPFGEIAMVRDWLGIEKPVSKPNKEHPKRPVQGFECTKSEVSGRRLWGLFAEKFVEPKHFFRTHFVVNYCPLVFMDEGARNITPDKLIKEEFGKLQLHCDEYLRAIVETLNPSFLVGVGAFAEESLRRVESAHRSQTPLLHSSRVITKILHPSPASPAANRDWSGTVTRQLIESAVWR